MTLIAHRRVFRSNQAPDISMCMQSISNLIEKVHIAVLLQYGQNHINLHSNMLNVLFKYLSNWGVTNGINHIFLYSWKVEVRSFSGCRLVLLHSLQLHQLYAKIDQHWMLEPGTPHPVYTKAVFDRI